MSLNPGSKLMQLGDDQAVFQIEDFKGIFRFQYEYISEPPIFFDMGNFDLIVNDTNLKVNFSTVMDESKILQVNINEFILSIQPFSVSFNGESDMSFVISEYLTFFGNFARSRIISI